MEGPTYTVYAVVDPRDGEVVYVGCTRDTRARFAAHCCRRSPIGAWARAEGVRPRFEAIESGLGRRWALWRERELIERARPLLNVCHARRRPSRLRAALAARGWAIKDLAREAGITPTSASNLARGVHPPARSTADRIAALLDEPAAALFESITEGR